MKSIEIIGSISTIILAAIILYVIVGKPPIYENWTKIAMDRLVPAGFIDSGRAISITIWNDLFLALLGLSIAIISFTIVIIALLRR